MKKQRTGSTYQRSWAQTRQSILSSPLEKDFDSDIEDSDQDANEEAGYDGVVDGISDPIEGLSDDELFDSYQETTTVTPAIDMEDIDGDTDEENRASHIEFKPFKALAGLDQWRPNSSAQTSHRTSQLEFDLEAIENERLSDTGDDQDNDSISTVLSLDETSLVSPDHSPPTSPIRSTNDNVSPSQPRPSGVPGDTPKASSFSHPSFSLYQQPQDTQHLQHKVPQAPSFILDSINNQHANYKTHLPIIEGGLASMALNCINQELSAFHEWQTLINVEMAKYGSVTRIYEKDGGRLCRCVDVWEDRGLLFAWCVDVPKPESIVVAPEDPYLCLFSTAYLDTPHHKVTTKLKKAPHLAIWPPWTNVPISVNDTNVFVHLVTRFRIDDSF